MKKTITITAGTAIAFGVLLAPTAAASPESDILCFTNPAYRTLHQNDNCKGDGVGNFTGGGGACGVTNPPASCSKEEEDDDSGPASAKPASGSPAGPDTPAGPDSPADSPSSDTGTE